MARRKIVMLVAGLAALALGLGVGLGGCKDLTFNGDMKGFLEYWTGTVTVGGFTWEAENDQRQKNKFGVWTIPTNATVSIKATIENPDNYPLDYGVGTAADTLRSVRTAGPVGGTVRVTSSSPTSIELELVPFSSVPTPESRALEHKDFTLTVVPTRTDSGLQAANPQVLTLRYNTPPRMPVEVVENNGSFSWLDSSPWGISQSGPNKDVIFWAWPANMTKSGGGDSTDPDYVEYFDITDDDGTDRVPEEDWQFPDKKNVQTIKGDDGTDYNIYWYMPTGEFTVCAVDGEEVASQGTVSGRSPIPITLNANGGAFKDGSNITEVYKAEGAMVSGGDFETPQLAGSVLSGWSLTQGGDPITFPHPVPSSPLTLYARWRSDWSGYISSLGPGPHTVSIDTTLTAEDVYALRTAIAGSPDAKITLDLSKATFDNNRLPESAFNGSNTSQGTLSNLVAVTLPDNLVEVGDHAFTNCTGLTSVTIKNGVQTIGEGAFYGCSALTNVAIPDSVTSIGAYAFEKSGLTSVAIPKSVQTIGGSAFLDCIQLTSLTIAEGVQSIAGHAFQNTGLASVTIPGSVQTIGTCAFHSCPQLKSVTIANGVKTIEQSAFAYSGLTSVTIPGSVQTTGLDAFHNCAQLQTVTIQEGVKTIGQGSFIHCTALTSITIPRSVTSIEPFALQDTGLTSVTIPGNVQTIGQDAFSGCAKLTSVTIEDGVKTIEQGAFHVCPALTSVTIPGSVETIGKDTFWNCPALTNVTIANGVQTIGQGVFCRCSALTNVVIPDTVTSIGPFAFELTGITSITIPKSVTSIGIHAFLTSKLTTVNYPGTEEEWKKIAIGDPNNELNGATKNYSP